MAVTNGNIGGQKPSYTYDASGNVIGLNGPDGVIIPIPAVVDAGTATQTATVAAGEHTSIAIALPGYYRVDPDMDIYVKGSDASALYGAELTADTDMYSTTAGSLAAQTGLDFGAASFSVELWLNLSTPTPTSARPLSFGGSGAAQLALYFSNTSATNIRVGSILTGNGNVAINDDSAAGDLGADYPLSSQLRHYVVTFERASGAGTGTVTYYIDATQVRQDTWTEAAIPTSFDLTSVTGTGRLVIGGTIGANAEWDGRIEDIKFYSTLLTLAQVQARNNAGPLRNAAVPIDAADLSLIWWINFQQSGSWADATKPECVSGYGNAVFASLVGSPAITERTGGTIATASDNKIYAGKPEVVVVNNDYLSVYSDSLSAGNVRLTKVA